MCNTPRFQWLLQKCVLVNTGMLFCFPFPSSEQKWALWIFNIALHILLSLWKLNFSYKVSYSYTVKCSILIWFWLFSNWISSWVQCTKFTQRLPQIPVLWRCFITPFQQTPFCRQRAPPLCRWRVNTSLTCSRGASGCFFPFIRLRFYITSHFSHDCSVGFHFLLQ